MIKKDPSKTTTLYAEAKYTYVKIHDYTDKVVIGRTVLKNGIIINGKDSIRLLGNIIVDNKAEKRYGKVFIHSALGESIIYVEEFDGIEKLIEKYFMELL